MIKERINKYDNLKGMAIFMIVLWHLDILRTVDPLVYKVMYLTSLPIFFFVSGYFSKIGPDEPIKAFKRLLIPYLVFCLISKLFSWFVMGHPPKLAMFVYSSFALWFLISLFTMKILLPIFDRLRYPLVISIICAVAIGFIDVHPLILGLTRTFAYMPIFLIGFYYNSYKEKLQTNYSRFTAYFQKYSILFVVLSLLFIFAAILVMPQKHFLFKDAFSGNLLYESIKRIIVLAAMMLAVLLLNRFMTNRKCILTKFGVNSMAVYILHTFLRIYLEPVFPAVFAHHKAIFLPFVLILAFCVVFILSRDIITKYLNMFTDGIYNLIAKPIEK